MTDTITLTAFRSVYREDGQGWMHSTEDSARSMRGTLWVERVTTCLAVGDSVQVQAYGRMRTGHVTKLGRTKATVKFVRNQQGDVDERTFGATEIRSENSVTTNLDAPKTTSPAAPARTQVTATVADTTTQQEDSMSAQTAEPVTSTLVYGRNRQGAPVAHKPACSKGGERDWGMSPADRLTATPCTGCKPSPRLMEEAREQALEAQAFVASQGTAELAGGDVQPLPVKAPATRKGGKAKSGDPRQDRAPKAQPAADTQVCTGACRETKPLTSFPTVARKDGTGRGTECRACRDARRKSATVV